MADHALESVGRALRLHPMEDVHIDRLLPACLVAALQPQNKRLRGAGHLIHLLEMLDSAIVASAMALLPEWPLKLLSNTSGNASPSAIATSGRVSIYVRSGSATDAAQTSTLCIQSITVSGSSRAHVRSVA